MFNLKHKVMKANIKVLTVAMLVLFSLPAISQQRDILNFRSPDQRGVNVFETIKSDTGTFNGLKVNFGGAFALQYQGINHYNGASFVANGEGENINQLIDLGDNFNLATANMNINVQLAKGVRMNLVTYLSSRHHPEPYVKGGYFQIDRLDFIKEGFADQLMDMVTIKIGHMENNYGDAHFRRTDNAMSIYNPFVGNYIMDGFTTEVGGEIYLQKNGLLAMVGLSNGKLNQDVKNPGSTKAAFIGKLGYDKQLSDDLRLRLTGSVYSTGTSKSINLYSADRAGSRYYSVMESITASRDDFRSGRWNPKFADKLTAIMINPFIKWRGLELFGTYEKAEGGDFKGSDETRTWNQIAGEVIYRFGPNEKVYAGARFNTVSGKLANSDLNKVTINRNQLAIGWFLTKNVLAKFEYVNQNYRDFTNDNIYKDGRFKGVMFEAVIAF